MPHYLLAVHASPDEPGPDLDAEEQKASWAALQTLEAEMRRTGTWVFSARLHDPDTATVVRREGGETLLTDGPYAESKEHIAGFYVISADDLDDALAWAGRVVDCIHVPLEVRPFAAWAA